jgi:hypothetical protein
MGHVTSADAEDQDVGSANFMLKVCREGSEVSDGIFCNGYLRGLFDANDIQTFVYKRPMWCFPRGVTLDQIRRVVVADVEKNPAEHHLPFAGLAHLALLKAFPCAKGKKPPS